MPLTRIAGGSLFRFAQLSEDVNNHPPAKPVVFPMRAKPSVPRARVKRVNNDSCALRYDPIGASRYTIPPYIPPFPQGGLNAEKQLSRMAASLLESRLRSKSPLCVKGGWSEGPGGIVSLRRFLFIASRLSRTTRLTSGFAIQQKRHHSVSLLFWYPLRDSNPGHPD